MNPRPTLITWLCIWEGLGILGLVALAITLYWSDIRAEVAHTLGPESLQVLVLGCLLQPLRCVGIIGLWKLKSWSLFMFGAYILCSSLLWLYAASIGKPDMLNSFAHIMSLILLITGIRHRGKLT